MARIDTKTRDVVPDVAPNRERGGVVAGWSNSGTRVANKLLRDADRHSTCELSYRGGIAVSVRWCDLNTKLCRLSLHLAVPGRPLQEG